MSEEEYKPVDLKLIKMSALLLVITTTIYILIKWTFFPSPTNIIYHLIPFPFFVPESGASILSDFLGTAASIPIVFYTIKLLRILYKAGENLAKNIGKRLEEMHKGWGRVHKIICLLVCCYTLNHFVFSDPYQMNQGFFKIIFMVVMGSTIYVIVPYSILLYLFLWIKDGFNKKK